MLRLKGFRFIIFVVPANTVAIWGFTGPSIWQPGGRRTLVLKSYDGLLPQYLPI